ncbi:MAG TPA: PilZ domain-containing protein [Pyrinomonadaceae bacterium]|jgi:hypothetical protein
MFSAWDTINRNRRMEARYRTRLPASVSVVESGIAESRWPSILGYTRDVSRDGMALVIPTSRLGCYELGQGDHRLRIFLAISAEVRVGMIVRLVHCGVFSEDEAEAGYLIGVKIEELGPEDRLLYDEFIASLH